MTAHKDTSSSTDAGIARSLRGLARARRRRARRGVALVMVLGALTILTMLLTEFQNDSSTEFGSVLLARDAVQAEYAAASAINLSRLLIAAEPTIRKTLAPLFIMMKSSPPQIPVWEFADQVLGAFNDEQGGAAFQGLTSVNLAEGQNLSLGLPGVGFDIKIIDEDSKIDLNSPWHDLSNRVVAPLLGLMQPAQFDPMFENRDSDGQFSDRQAICGAIIDWVDENDLLCPCDPLAPFAQAPEDNFYQMLDEPYERKNAPFDSLEELRFVRGISDDFWASFVDPDPEDQSKRPVTVWGRGKVNVNTANAQTLYALICGTSSGELPKMCTDVEEATKFFSVMSLVKAMTAGAPLFPTTRAFLSALAHKGMYGEVLKMLGLQPILFKTRTELEKQIDVQSKVFSIYATGRVTAGGQSASGRESGRQTTVRIHAIVDFRGAPKPAAVDDPSQTGGTAGAGNTAGASTGTTGTTTAAPEDALLQALLSNPAGKLIYYRVE